MRMNPKWRIRVWLIARVSERLAGLLQENADEPHAVSSPVF
jgi:hypothetical protein